MLGLIGWSSAIRDNAREKAGIMSRNGESNLRENILDHVTSMIWGATETI